MYNQTFRSTLVHGTSATAAAAVMILALLPLSRRVDVPRPAVVGHVCPLSYVHPLTGPLRLPPRPGCPGPLIH